MLPKRSNVHGLLNGRLIVSLQQEDKAELGDYDARIKVFAERLPCHGTVHRARVDHHQPEPLRKQTRNGAFARSRGAVDGDGEMFGFGRRHDGHEVGSMKSAGRVFSPNIFSIPFFSSVFCSVCAWLNNTVATNAMAVSTFFII